MLVGWSYKIQFGEHDMATDAAGKIPPTAFQRALSDARERMSVVTGAGQRWKEQAQQPNPPARDKKPGKGKGQRAAKKTP